MVMRRPPMPAPPEVGSATGASRKRAGWVKRFGALHPPVESSLGLGERVGVDLVEHLVIADNLLDEALSVALGVNLRRFLQAAEVLVLGVGCLLSELVSHEAVHLGNKLRG